MRLKNLLKYNYAAIPIFIIIGILPGCFQDVIDLDISNIDRPIVIVGKIIEGNSSNYIKINRVGSLSITDDFPPVNNAEVIISDDVGNTEILNEVTPGNYKSNSIIGEADREYTLQINVDAKEFYSVSRMPQPIELDTIFVYKTSEYNNSHYISLSFADEADKPDYLMIRIYINNLLNEIHFYNDEYSDGEQITLDKDNFNSKLYPQQSIKVEIITLDEQTYRYYTLLFRDSELTGGNGEETEVDVSDLISSSNFNPNNNFSNDALGYFSAQAIRIYTLAVQ